MERMLGYLCRLPRCRESLRGGKVGRGEGTAGPKFPSYAVLLADGIIRTGKNRKTDQQEGR